MSLFAAFFWAIVLVACYIGILVWVRRQLDKEIIYDPKEKSIDRDEEILSWLQNILSDEGISDEQSDRIKNSLSDAIVNHLGDD